MEQQQTRYFGLDVIRTFASIAVIAGHFFVLHTPFYDAIFKGYSMTIQSMAVFLFNACGVPLYLLITGYLNGKKEFNFKLLKTGGGILKYYIIFSIITIIFRACYLGEEKSIFSWVDSILRFDAIPYAWYIEMWIGLFLMIPFLNIMYRGIKSQKHKQILIGVLFILTAVPHLTNRYGFHLTPDYWMAAYPLTFYFIGLYIKEYQPTINRALGWGIIAAILLINPIFNMIFMHDHSIVQIAGDSSGVFGFILATTLFLLLYKCKSPSTKLSSLLSVTSKLSLNVYLICYCFDALYYPYFKERFYIDQSQFGIWFFVIVPLVYLSSLAVAYIVDRIAASLRYITSK